MAQEILIQCGKFLLDWRAIEHAVTQSEVAADRHATASTRETILAKLLQSIPYSIHLQRNSRFDAQSSSSNIFELFCLNADAVCERKQDRFFGLLGLSQPCCREAIRPNYELPLSGLCHKVLEHYFQKHEKSETIPPKLRAAHRNRLC